MAGALGFEPRLTDPESAVLPLYDAPEGKHYYLLINFLSQVYLVIIMLYKTRFSIFLQLKGEQRSFEENN